MPAKSTKPKRGFMDGYKLRPGQRGSPDQWKSVFNRRMGLDEATQILGDDDPLDILQMSFGATHDEIKKAFRAAALKFHPDMNKGKEAWAAEQFKRVYAAYVKLGGKQ